MKRTCGFLRIEHFPQLYLDPVYFSSSFPNLHSSLETIWIPIMIKLKSTQKLSILRYGLYLSKNSKKLLQKFQENFTYPGYFSYLKHGTHPKSSPFLQRCCSTSVRRRLLETLRLHPTAAPLALFTASPCPVSLSTYLTHLLYLVITLLLGKRTASFITSLCIFQHYDDPKCCSFTQEHIISTANEKRKLPKVKHCFVYTFIDLRQNTMYI